MAFNLSSAVSLFLQSHSIWLCDQNPRNSIKKCLFPIFHDVASLWTVRQHQAETKCERVAPQAPMALSDATEERRVPCMLAGTCGHHSSLDEQGVVCYNPICHHLGMYLMETWNPRFRSLSLLLSPFRPCSYALTRQAQVSRAIRLLSRIAC